MSVLIIGDGDKLVVAFPYDPVVVASFKDYFHYQDRKWDPDAKAWVCPATPLVLARLKIWAEAHGGGGVIEPSAMAAVYANNRQGGYTDQHKPPPPPPRPAAGQGTSPYHDMIARLPPDVLKKVYRLIATECHPDKGGSTEIMQRVNAAWDKIRDLF